MKGYSEKNEIPLDSERKKEKNLHIIAIVILWYHQLEHTFIVKSCSIKLSLLCIWPLLGFVIC
jgi:hypothetical protein